MHTRRPPETPLRAAFERFVGDRNSYGLKRSLGGTYVNPAIARDWKWFQLGAQAMGYPTVEPSEPAPFDPRPGA